MVSKDDIIRAAKPKLSSFANNYTDLLSANINKVFRDEALPALRDQYVLEYDKLVDIVEGLTPPAISGKDPLSLKNQRGLFISNLDKQLQTATIDENGLSLSLTLTGRVDDEGIPSGPDSLNYYIEGFTGEVAFITPEQKKERNPKSEASLGRVGGGFVIDRRQYAREKWEETTGLSFNEVRHPISGFSPFKGFAEVPERMMPQFSDFVRKAIQLTNNIVEGSRL